MRSRQLNYFILEDDYVKIDEYLREENIKISALPLYEKKIRLIDSLNRKNQDDWIDVILYKSGNEKNIEIEDIKLIEGGISYSIDTIKEPIVELGRCFYDTNNKQLRRSRIYFITHFYNDKDVLQSKSEEFLKWTDKFYKWLRKHLTIIKEGRYKGFYASEKVLELLQKKAIELID